MITVHENGKIYRVQLRAAYSHIRSEKQFRADLENAIANWEKISPAYAAALRKKPLFELCSIFGIITAKVEVNPKLITQRK